MSQTPTQFMNELLESNTPTTKAPAVQTTSTTENKVSKTPDKQTNRNTKYNMTQRRQRYHENKERLTKLNKDAEKALAPLLTNLEDIFLILSQLPNFSHKVNLKSYLKEAYYLELRLRKK